MIGPATSDGGLIRSLVATVVLWAASSPLLAQPPPAGELVVLDHQGAAVTTLTDGDLITVRVSLAQAVQRDTSVTFRLEHAAAPVATCRIARGARQCETATFRAFGWFWSEAGEPWPQRRLTATATALASPIRLELRILPRPVVLVHGFIADAEAWQAYTQPGGFLDTVGLPAFAVGDAQVAGALSTGDVARATQRTATLAENAAALGRYIAGVKAVSGSETVDLVAHSMGGLIARYYIDRVMAGRDVAQLLMLGTPNGGSDCAKLPAALGFYLPAALELRPAYLQGIFNQQITRRLGVPFYLLAGTAITRKIAAPCTEVPSDLVVGLTSATAIPSESTELPLLHTDLTSSREVFEQFVLPHLAAAPGTLTVVSDDPPSSAPQNAAQTTQVLIGQVLPGTSQTLTIDLDAVTVASFALFDPTRSLELTVHGASGKLITLSPDQHGLITVDDPASLVHLGYGFEHPSPGVWRVTLSASLEAPAGGAPFALAAQVVGGAVLEARVSKLLPEVGERQTLTATLTLAGQPLEGASVRASILEPNGAQRELTLGGTGSVKRATWIPEQRGLHGITVMARGTTSAGWSVERTVFLAVEVQPRRAGWVP